MAPHRLRGFGLNQPQAAVRPGDEEVHLQTLLIAEIVKLLAHSPITLTLEYFRRDEAFE